MEKTFRELYASHPKGIVIPSFQRDYTWGEGEGNKELLREFFELMYSDFYRNRSAAHKEKNYISDMIVWVQDGSANIVDGHQRTITLSAMIHYLERGKTIDGKPCFMLASGLNTLMHTFEGGEKVICNLSYEDKNYVSDFHDLFLDGAKNDFPESLNNLSKYIVNFFTEKETELRDTLGYSSAEVRKEFMEFHSYLTSEVQFYCKECSTKAQAINSFINKNRFQKLLSFVDKLKINLIKDVSISNEYDYLVSEFRACQNKLSKRTMPSHANLDKKMKFVVELIDIAYHNGKSFISKEIEKRFLSPDHGRFSDYEKARAFLKSWKEILDHLDTAVEHYDGQYKNIVEAKAFTFMQPIILAELLEVPEEDMKLLMAFIKRLVISCWLNVGALGQKKAEKIVLDLCVLIREKKRFNGLTLEQFIDDTKQTVGGDCLPIESNRAHLKNILKNLSYQTEGDKPKIKYVLYFLESALQHNTGKLNMDKEVNRLFDNKTTIHTEHIIPQIELNNPSTTNEQRLLIDCLGNLTIWGIHDNGYAKDKPYTEKRKAFHDAGYILTRNLSDSYDAFGYDDINGRCDAMIAIVVPEGSRAAE
jgi:hypothetical protein